jgi:hypothetical protein
MGDLGKAMRVLFCGLLVLLCAPAWASTPALADFPVVEWSQVEDIERSARAGGVAGYQSSNGSWLLVPDGRLAMLIARGDDDGPRSAMLGRYRFQGAWLAIELDGSALDLASLSKEQRADYEEWQATSAAAQAAADVADAGEDAADPAAEAEAAPPARAFDDIQARAELQSEIDAAFESFRRPRFLRVPYRGGELLVREQFLPMIANGWDGKGPLQVHAEAWRLPAAAAPQEDESSFEIADPLRAGLPHELARLLRADAIEARVTEVDEDAQSLRWERQRAKVHLRLDRGEHAGLYAGMYLRGLPPDEEFSGKIVSAGAKHARLELHLERFAPGDAVALPAPGVRFTTRSERGACAIDTGVALRAKVETVATPAERVRWDDEGYAWFELRLDQGAAQGLAAGDRLHAEDDEIDGEGRVLSVASRHATVQWRAQRYSAEMPVRLPAAGDALVTPAWQRAEWDVFGEAAQP